jgi:hypothetical protein
MTRRAPALIAVIICAAVLMCAANPEVLLAEDDWVQVPSTNRNSNSAPAAPSNSQHNPAAAVAEPDAKNPADTNGVIVGSTSSSNSIGATIATGTISGLRSGGNPEMDLRLRPQPNGFLHGELVIHQPGFGTTPIEGFVRGNHLQFQVPYGSETYCFEGQRRSDQISGTFESTPSGERGTWGPRRIDRHPVCLLSRYGRG